MWKLEIITYLWEAAAAMQQFVIPWHDIILGIAHQSMPGRVGTDQLYSGSAE